MVFLIKEHQVLSENGEFFEAETVNATLLTVLSYGESGGERSFSTETTECQ